MRTILCARFALASLFGTGLLAAPCSRAATVVWDGGPAGTSAVFLTPANWVGDVRPGSGDVGEFGALGTANPVTINFNTSGLIGNNVPIQAISVVAGRNSNLILNPSTVTNGTLTLGGATVNGIANTILSNFSGSNNSLTLQNGTGGNGTMTAALGGTASVIQAAQSRTISISSPISQVNANSAVTFLGSGTLSAAGGTLELSGSNSFTGGITVGASDGTQAGLLRLANASALPNAGNVVINSNSQLLLTGATTYGQASQTVTINGAGLGSGSEAGGALRVQSVSAALNAGLSIGSAATVFPNSGQTLTLAGNVTDGGNTLTKQGAGTLAFTAAANAMTGTFIIKDGEVTVATGSSIGTAGLVLAQNSSRDTTATFNNTTQTLSSLSTQWNQASGTRLQTLTLNGTSLIVDQATDTTFGNGVVSTLQGVIAGAGSVTKSGGGSLTLTGANSYAGGTTISDGALYASNDTASSATGSGDIIISSDGMLGGTGRSSGAVTVNGTLAAGDTLTAVESLDTGALTFSTGSTLAFQLNSGAVEASGADLINSSGTLTIDAGANLTFSDVGATLLPLGRTISILSYLGNAGGTAAAFAGYANNTTFAVGPNTYRINYDAAAGGLNFGGGTAGAGRSFVTLTTVAAVPEASALLLGGMIATGALLIAARQKLRTPRAAGVPS